MSSVAGLRRVKVLENVTSGELNGNFQYLEVTNSGGADIKFYPNDYPMQGHPATDGIPIKAGTTRDIPMWVANFKATGAVTVVAYGA